MLTAQGGSWEAAALSFAGPGHDGSQDSSIALAGPDWVVLAVADGAGSAARAAEGSQIALGLLSRYVTTDPPRSENAVGARSWLGKLVRDVGTAWTRTVLSLAPSSDDFDTTFAVALVLGGSLHIATVGDGFVLIIGDTDMPELLVPPERPGKLSSSETYMLPDWEQHTRYFHLFDEQLRLILLSTDGLERFLLTRVVRRGAELSPTFIGVKPWLANFASQLSESRNFDLLDELKRDDVIALKGDDVGVAVAIRQ